MTEAMLSVWTTCPGLYPKVRRSGIEPATCWLQPQRPNNLDQPNLASRESAGFRGVDWPRPTQGLLWYQHVRNCSAVVEGMHYNECPSSYIFKCSPVAHKIISSEFTHDNSKLHSDWILSIPWISVLWIRSTYWASHWNSRNNTW